MRSTNGAGIGVALSSGGAASLAQVGALETLLEAGIPVDFVAGTSAGAIIGAVYTSGQLEAFRDAFATFTWRQTLGFFKPIWSRGALLECRSAFEFTGRFVAERIEDLAKPFAAVAADLATGAEVVIRSGSVIEALRASCAIPGIFPPSLCDGRWLVDGALVNPIPVSIARELGARFTIAINVLLTDDSDAERFARAWRAPARPKLRDQIASLLPWARRTNGHAVLAETPPAIEATGAAPRVLRLFSVLAHATRIVQLQLAAARLWREPPDVLINVPVGDTGTFDLHRGADLIELGRKAARVALPEIERALSRRRFRQRFVVERAAAAAAG